MRIAQITLAVRDIDRMRSFYTDYFDAAAGGVHTEPKTGARACCLDFQGGMRIRLICTPENIKCWPDGNADLMFSVGSRDAVNELTLRLGDAGYEILAGPFEKDGVYLSSVLDPEENQIDITE